MNKTKLKNSFLETAHGRIRYAITPNVHDKPLIILLPGVTEPIEKYAHVIERLVERGFAVACLDWPDQGLSTRYLKGTTARYSHGFDKEAEAFAAFYKHLAKHVKTERIIVLAHSMGAHLALRALLNEPPMKPETLLLSVPFIDLYFPSKSEGFVSRFLIKAACLSGFSKHCPPGRAEWSPEQFDKTKDKYCSDPVRKNLLKEIYAEKPELTSGGITFGWLNEALKSIAWLKRNRSKLQTLNMPVHVFLAEQDLVVDNKAIEQFFADHATAQIHRLPYAYHEILMEPDALQAPLWRVINSLQAN